MKAAIASRKADPAVAAGVTVTADRDRTEMPAGRVADVIVDRARVAADVTVGRAAAAGVIVIADHADRVRMDLVLKVHRRPAVTVDRAKNIVTEILDAIRAVDHAKADQIVTVTDSARTADRADVTVVPVAEDRSMHADRVRADRTAKVETVMVDARKVRADAPITRAEATADRVDKADDRSPNTHAGRSPARPLRHPRELAKKFRDSSRSCLAEVSRLNL
jgi:hypothetical protein